MKCYNHPAIEATSTCAKCGNNCCIICAIEIDGKTMCRPCAQSEYGLGTAKKTEETPETIERVVQPMSDEKLAMDGQKTGKPKEEPVSTDVKDPETIPEPKQPAEPVQQKKTPVVITPEPAPAPAPAPASKSFDKKEQPYVPPPTPPAPKKEVTDKPKDKEPLLALILSLLIPGAGQAYNGQIKKGIVFFIILVTIWIFVMILSFGGAMFIGAPSALCCLQFMIPFIFNLYAGYDAYVRAKKINDGEPVSDWFS